MNETPAVGGLPDLAGRVAGFTPAIGRYPELR